MTQWHFRLRGGNWQSIDASPIQRRWLSEKPKREIEALQLIADGVPMRLNDLFELTVAASVEDQIVVEGQLRRVHGLGTEHDRGEFCAVGSVGNYLASGMIGGSISIDGDAGDFVAAPVGTHKLGMSGGVVKIAGDAGNYAGHRMRRGTIMIQGASGAMLAASMVAGTICVGGKLDKHLAVGMKRGSLVLANGIGLIEQADQLGTGPSSRFSPPVRFDPGFLHLYRDPDFKTLTRPLRRLPVFRTRADRTIGGQGEIIFPATAETAY